MLDSPKVGGFTSFNTRTFRNFGAVIAARLHTRNKTILPFLSAPHHNFDLRTRAFATPFLCGGAVAETFFTFFATSPQRQLLLTHGDIQYT
jgi:hypothetical protein